LLELFEARRAALEALFEGIGKKAGLTITPFARDKRKAERWLNDPQVSVDGVVAKRLDLPYRPGERAMLKIKHLRTADCVVGGFRYETGQKQVGSLLLGLYDKQGVLHHVAGFSAPPTRKSLPSRSVLKSLWRHPASPAMRPAGPAAGTQRVPLNGNRFAPSW
jgi:ATP-dependent DNA ligase